MDALLDRIRPASPDSIAAAAQLVVEGKLVAFPTETVYGLGADASNGEAVAAIFAAKGRPHFNPLIVHVADTEAARRQGVFNPLAEKLAAALWPGPLTLVLPRRADATVSLLVSGGLNSVALRVPSHPLAQALLAAAQRPLAAPSANASGRITTTNAEHVARELGGRVDLILDGGATPLGLESTVIGFEDERAVLLRPGAIARDAIERITGPLAAARGTIQSPGQLESHYSPQAQLRLNATKIEPGEALLGFGAVAEAWLNLSPRGDLTEAAANLFSMLRDMDDQVNAIAVSPIPETGLGEAINDRLRRAAAPR